MMWRAACLTTTSYFALIGAVLFAFGDTLIAIDRFYQPISGARYPIILSYWFAQLFIISTAKETQTKSEYSSTQEVAL
jgi:uncharacterized membrane protein YhhN